ncbi:hypothetical protein [Paraburkholderia hospita]|uniref:hypothetical protein n=1 Tax=Paraburkholderia hospita TaxID=169430 RepID=UPI001054DDF9|nr:hypothetical protein [Paraburkholderia hospita]
MGQGLRIVIVVIPIACFSPLASAYSGGDILQIGMLNPTDINQTPVTDDVSVSIADRPPSSRGLASPLHVSERYPEWQYLPFHGSTGRLQHLRGNGFYLNGDGGAK